MHYSRTYDGAAARAQKIADRTQKPVYFRKVGKRFEIGDRRQLDSSYCEPTAKVYCQNCQWRGYESEVDPDIPDFHERVAPGEICPVGECPKCRALCHYVKSPAKSKR